MSHEIRLYNTLSRSVERLEPLNPPRVGIYTCGLTVYGYPHIGNYRAYVAEDLLVKTLRYFGYEVDRVMNITDVGHLVGDVDDGEDKMEVGARREGKSAWEVAKFYEQAFVDDFKVAHIELPEKLVRATDTIQEQIEFIKGLEAKGYTYQIADGVYFDSSKVSDYGLLARLDIEGLQAGARVEMQEGKKSITDFALWKLSPSGAKRDMEWESPWGVGFPGWHIECSAIALKELGPELDIHGGGVDHIPVHHTNEIAQSKALTGKELAKIWFHVEFLQVDGGKMSKSLGNGYTRADLEEKGFSLLDFRYFTYSASYRSKLNFTWEALASAKVSFNRLKGAISLFLDEGEESIQPETQVYIDRIEAALADDLNTAEVMAALWEVVKSDISNAQKNLIIRRFEPVLSLGLTIPEIQEEVIIPTQVSEWAKQRSEARLSNDWAESDRLRDLIKKEGFQVKDEQNGSYSLKSIDK